MNRNGKVRPEHDDSQLTLKLQLSWPRWTAAMKQQGFTKTLKLLNRGRFPASGMMSVHEGVVENYLPARMTRRFKPTKVLYCSCNAEGPDREPTDPQMIPSIASQSIYVDAKYGELTAEQIVHQLTDAGPNPLLEASLHGRADSLRSITTCKFFSLCSGSISSIIATATIGTNLLP